jgi:hypothetical protein
MRRNGFATGNQGLALAEMTPFYPTLFDLRGVAFAAWTLAAFAIGALAGMLIRRSSPRSPPHLPPTPGSPSRPRCTCASTT